MSSMNSTTLDQAKEDVRDVCSAGPIIKVHRPTKNGIDEFKGVLTTTYYSLNAFPIRFSPFENKISQKISWAEEVEAIFYVAKKQLDTLGIDRDDIKQCRYVEYDGKDYELKYADYYSQFATDWLYLVIGASK